MAMNIEQRLEQSAKSIEQSSQKAHDFAEKDTTLQTCAGSRDSLPKVSRIWQENFARQMNQHATEFQDRFALSQQSLPWQAGITISDSLQRYHVGVQGEEGYKEFLPNPVKLPFETAATLAEDLTQDRWLENGVPNKHWTESKVASALEKSLGMNARIWPKRGDLQVGDVIPSAQETADGLPITHLVLNGNVYAMSPPAAGAVTSINAGSVTVGGIAAETDEDLTNIRPDALKIASMATRYGQDLRAVVTGGSVSWNGFGYQEMGWTVDGAGYATDAPFGLSSWSYLVRDYLLAANPSHRPINDISIDKRIGVNFFEITTSGAKNYGMNVRCMAFVFHDVNSVLKLKAGGYHSQFLLVSTRPPGSEDLIFDVNGVAANNTATSSNYGGYGYKKIPATGDIEITNVRRANGSAAGDGTLVIYGITGPGNFDFNITGKGGYSSGQVLSEYDTLIRPYQPNVLMLMVGGNDVDQSVSIETYKQNLRTIVDNARSDVPECIVVLFGLNPNNNLDKSKQTLFNRAARNVADEKKCSFIDVFYKMNRIDKTYWMFDHVHLNANGDTILFNIVKEELFSSVVVDNTKFVATRGFMIATNNRSWYIDSAARGNDTPTNVSIRAEAGTPTINVLSGSGVTAKYIGSGVNSVLEVEWENEGIINGFIPLYVDGELSVTIVPYQSPAANRAQFIALTASGARFDINGCAAYFRLSIS